MSKVPLNYDSLNYVMQLANNKQLFEVSKQVDELTPPDWHKFVIPVVSLITAVIGAISAYYVTMALFKRNRELELEKINISNAKEERNKIETSAKEKDDLLRRLYADAFEMQQALLIDLASMNHSLTDYFFFFHVSEVVTDANAKKFNFDQYIEHEKRFINTRSKVVEYNNKLLKAVGEYKYINPDTNIMQLVDELRKYPYDCNQVKQFNTKMTIDELTKTRDEQNLFSSNYVSTKIIARTNKIVECIRLYE